MTAGLSTGRQPIDFPLSNVSLPLGTSLTVYQGAALYLDTVANVVKPGVAGNPNLIPAGTAQQAVTTTSSTGQILVRLYDELMCQWFDNSSANAVTALFSLCYVDSDHSVSSLQGGNSVAGRVWAIDTVKGVLVQPLVTNLVSYPGEDAGGGESVAFSARACLLTIHAYNGTGTGTLTSTANGSFSSQNSADNVTVKVGDILFAQAGLSNLQAVDSGPWQVTSLGGAGKWVMTRPSWWSTGATWVSGAVIQVGGEGQIYQNTQWKATAAAGVIDTTDSAFYVGRITFQATLVSGTEAFAAAQPSPFADYPLTGSTSGAHSCPVGIYSASQSNAFVSCSTPATQTGTVGYGVKALTPGYAGTATFAAFAFATAQATVSGDDSTVNVTLINW